MSLVVETPYSTPQVCDAAANPTGMALMLEAAAEDPFASIAKVSSSSAGPSFASVGAAAMPKVVPMPPQGASVEAEVAACTETLAHSSRCPTASTRSGGSSRAPSPSGGSSVDTAPALSTPRRMPVAAVPWEPQAAELSQEPQPSVANRSCSAPFPPGAPGAGGEERVLAAPPLLVQTLASNACPPQVHVQRKAAPPGAELVSPAASPCPSPQPQRRQGNVLAQTPKVSPAASPTASSAPSASPVSFVAQHSPQPVLSFHQGKHQLRKATHVVMAARRFQQHQRPRRIIRPFTPLREPQQLQRHPLPLPAAGLGGSIEVAPPVVASSPRVGEDDSRSLDDLITAGDVLFCRGTGGYGLMELGTAGGWLGHVMLAVEQPRRILPETEDGSAFVRVWPDGVAEVWTLEAIESTRATPGLNRTTFLIYVHPETRRFILLGELDYEKCKIDMCEDELELWQSPAQLRSKLTGHITAVVLQDMDRDWANWSWSTAFRAANPLQDHKLNTEYDNPSELLFEVEQCWEREPICTSVIITFWQRCLLALADSDVEAAKLISKWMPLKADRSLPGALTECMKNRHWNRLQKPPRNHYHNALPVDHQGPQRVVDGPSPSQPAEPVRALPPQTTAPVHESQAQAIATAPRYCGDHATSALRAKGVERSVRCLGCCRDIQTTYQLFALCAECSEKEKKCMICRGEAPNAGTYRPPSTQQQFGQAKEWPRARAMPFKQLPARGKASAQAAAPAATVTARVPATTREAPARVAPRFCSRHDETGKRPKDATASGSRRCGSCSNEVLTCYAQVLYCESCSEKLEKCLICGERAPPSKPGSGPTVWSCAVSPASKVWSQQVHQGRVRRPPAERLT